MGNSYMSTANREEDAIAAYVREGERKAFELGNRGPIKFNSDGTLDRGISRCVLASRLLRV